MSDHVIWQQTVDEDEQWLEASPDTISHPSFPLIAVSRSSLQADHDTRQTMTTRIRNKTLSEQHSILVF